MDGDAKRRHAGTYAHVREAHREIFARSLTMTPILLSYFFPTVKSRMVTL